jgi:enoyl-CoA hydratase
LNEVEFTKNEAFSSIRRELLEHCLMNIKTDLQNGILTATISRSQALNALNAEVLDELNNIIKEVYQKKEIHGLIIIGEGEKAFVAGADIKELASLDQSEALNLSKKGQKLFSIIEHCPKPVIAAVNGFALGGGCELAMACHIRIATENAKFGQPEVNLGIIPGYGGTQRLTQLVGRGKALELMMTGDTITAQEAKTWGLVNHVTVNRIELIELATKILKKILSKSPLAISKLIRSVNAGFTFEQQGYDVEAQEFANCTRTEDFNEGTAAFIEKRQPNFKGI